MRFLRSKKVISRDDASVIAEYKKSADPVYIEVLFDRYCHLIFAVCMNYLKNEEDSKDAVIQVFEKLPEHLKKYEISNFSNWLYSVAKHHCFKMLKKRQFNAGIDEELNYFVADEEEEKDELTDQLLLHLDEAMLTLNEEQSKCVKMFYLEEKSYKEIEEFTGYNYEKVKSYIQNGKRNLKIYLTKKNGKR